jgi:hypothetical protein
MKNASFTIAIVITACLMVLSCTKSEITLPDDLKFYSLVETQDFKETGPLIDDFLLGLKKNQPDQNLDKLVTWLKSISCVDKVEIECNSCIETYPAQSEIAIDFVVTRQVVTKTMDIKMDERLKFLRYH